MRKSTFASLGIIAALLFHYSNATFAQENTNINKFRQLYQELPTPNEYRTASGAPGPKYWQQRTDYDMKLELDDESQRLHSAVAFLRTFDPKSHKCRENPSPCTILAFPHGNSFPESSIIREIYR